MRRPAKSAWSVDARELLAEHVAEDALVEVLTTTPYIETLTAETVRRREREQTEATRMALRILQREARGESEHAPFRGVLGALRALDEVRMDGAPVRSSSSPSRFEPEHRGSSGTAQGDAGQRAVERIAPVARQWSRCLVDGWTLTTYPAVVALSGPQARAVVVWATLGVPGSMLPLQSPLARFGEAARQKQPRARMAVRGRPRDGQDVDRYSDPSPREVADYASAQLGVEVPVGQVVALRREGILELYQRLEARGLIPRDGRLATMAAERSTPWDVQGWQEIAIVLGCSPRTAQSVAVRAERPAPTYKTYAGVVAVRAELAEWMAGEMRRAR